MDLSVPSLHMNAIEDICIAEENAMAYDSMAPIDPQLLPQNLASSALAALTHLPTVSDMWDASLGNWPERMGQLALNAGGGTALDARLTDTGKANVPPRPVGTFQAFQISCPIEPSHPFSRPQNTAGGASNGKTKNIVQKSNRKKPPAETMTVLSMDIHWAQRRKKKEKPVLDNEEQKRERERLKNMNRLAASKSRAKKKKKVNELEEIKIQLEEKNTLLHNEYRQLLGEIDEVKNLLISHTSCNDPNIERWIQNEARGYLQKLAEKEQMRKIGATAGAMTSEAHNLGHTSHNMPSLTPSSSRLIASSSRATLSSLNASQPSQAGPSRRAPRELEARSIRGRPSEGNIFLQNRRSSSTEDGSLGESSDEWPSSEETPSNWSPPAKEPTKAREISRRTRLRRAYASSTKPNYVFDGDGDGDE